MTEAEEPIVSPLPAIAGKRVSEDGNGNSVLTIFGISPESRKICGPPIGIGKSVHRLWRQLSKTALCFWNIKGQKK